MSCPADNTQAIDQSSFWGPDGVDWDAHKIGWVISGSCAAATVVISLVTILMHATHYTNRGQQRQILRILYMPPVYAVISFFSYRFFRSYTYYDLIETAYESITLSAFMLLLIDFVASTAAHHDVDNAIARKDKRPLPLPFCFLRYRPTKAYFMYTLKWSVLQYVIIRPVLSIVGIIAQRKGVLCESGSWSLHTAKAYITVIDAISITIALYGLVVFYGLTKDELKGKQPLAKFLSIKLIVMFTFYQSFVFSILEGRVIHATQYWTETNVADGLNALAICIEMVFFSLFMMWAYNWREYVLPDKPRTSIWRPLWDSINYWDFLIEIYGSLKFFVDYARGKPNTHGPRLTVTDMDGKVYTKMDFGEAFGVENASYPHHPPHPMGENGATSENALGRGTGVSDDGSSNSENVSGVKPRWNTQPI
ncbi:Organic solute transporter Ostalpha-domain-containing protein [Abortiporus biennis]